MALEDEMLALSTQAATARKRGVIARMRAIAERERVRAYQRLLLGENGELRPDAVTVLADLGRVAKMGIADGPQMSDAEIRIMGGRRSMVLHILSRLDLSGTKLGKLAAIIRENRDE